MNIIPYIRRAKHIRKNNRREEIGSLIGCFRQGKLENIVVFSDAYFKKAQGMWKYTNILTGDKIEEKALRIDGVTIKQGPTKLNAYYEVPELDSFSLATTCFTFEMIPFY